MAYENIVFTSAAAPVVTLYFSKFAHAAAPSADACSSHDRLRLGLRLKSWHVTKITDDISDGHVLPCTCILKLPFARFKSSG